MNSINLIDKIIQEWQDHFAKGNTTLGTLPNDWKNELNELLEDTHNKACEKQKEMDFMYAKVLRTKEEIDSDNKNHARAFRLIDKDSILKSPNAKF